MIYEGTVRLGILARKQNDHPRLISVVTRDCDRRKRTPGDAARSRRVSFYHQRRLSHDPRRPDPDAAATPGTGPGIEQLPHFREAVGLKARDGNPPARSSAVDALARIVVRLAPARPGHEQRL